MRGRTLTSLVSKARSVLPCRSSGSSVCEMNLGNACRSSLGTASGSSPIRSSMGNRRLSSYLTSLPREIAGTQSLLPLYSITASSRLVSQLSTNAASSLADLHGIDLRRHEGKSWIL